MSNGPDVVSCSVCGLAVQNLPEFAGRIVECPHCHRQFQMPAIIPTLQPPPIIERNKPEISIRVHNPKSTTQSSRRSRRKPNGDDTLNTILGLGGAALLCIGVFSPFIKAPFIGGVNYFQNGEGDGVFVLGFALLAMVLTLAKQFSWLLLPAIASLGLVAFTFINFKIKMEEMKQELEGNPFAELASVSISIEFGFAMIIVAALALVGAALVRSR